jgi:trimethylamine--corrinoid protein Co-methyltransferase
MQGLVVDDDSLAADGYREAGPGTAHLGTAHTLAHFADTNFIPDLVDTASFEQWTEGGSLDMQQRANAQWKRMLADYEPPDIDPGDAELRAFVDDRKAAEEDAWY